jgi:hypothetical protein
LPQAATRIIDGFHVAWPSASIEFCRFSESSGAGDTMVLPVNLLDIDKVQSFKVMKRVAVKELATKNVKFADERAVIARIQLALKQEAIPSNTKHVAGSIILDGMVGNVAGTLDAAIFARQLEAEFMDDLMVKTARSVVKDNGGVLAIIPPLTYYIPYLAIPLKIRVQSAPSDTTVTTREREMVASMIKRATSMVSSGRVALARLMIVALRDIASVLNEQDLVKRCGTLLDITKGMSEQGTFRVQ